MSVLTTTFTVPRERASFGGSLMKILRLSDNVEAEADTGKVRFNR